MTIRLIWSRPQKSGFGGLVALLSKSGSALLRFGRYEAPDDSRIVTVSREIAARVDLLFELIADPAQQPRWDGNDNLAEARAGQRVRRVGDMFTMRLTRGSIRENHVVEFEEGRCIAWMPSEPGQEPPGHLWRWELEPVRDSHTRVTHSYDWSRLTDKERLARARATTDDKLRGSLDRLAELVESGPVQAMAPHCVKPS